MKPAFTEQTIPSYVNQRVFRLSLAIFLFLETVIFIVTWVVNRQEVSHHLGQTASSLASIYRSDILSNQIKYTERAIRNSLNLSQGEVVKILNHDQKIIYEELNTTEPNENLTLKSCLDNSVCLTSENAFIYEPIFFDEEKKHLFGFLYLERELKWNWRLIILSSLFFGSILLLQLLGINRIIRSTSLRLSENILSWSNHLKKNPKETNDLPLPPYVELSPLTDSMKALTQQIKNYEAQANHDGKEIVLRGIAHDLINPLSQMQLYLATIEKSHLTLEVREMLDGLKNGMKKVGLIASQVKSIRNEPETPESFDLTEYITEEVASFINYAGVKRNRLTFEVKGNQSISAFISKVEASRIIQNLIINSIEASVPDSTITIEVEETEDTVVLKVSDRGFGISNLLQDRIFDEGVTTKHEFGSGLGLSIVRFICHQRNGSVALTSKPNVGTIVTVQLPTFDIGLANVV